MAATADAESLAAHLYAHAETARERAAALEAKVLEEEAAEQAAVRGASSFFCSFTYCRVRARR